MLSKEQAEEIRINQIFELWISIIESKLLGISDMVNDNHLISYDWINSWILNGDEILNVNEHLL